MQDYRLLKSQKNEVLSVIRAEGLNPLDFRVEEERKVETDLVGLGNTSLANRHVHTPSGYSFFWGGDWVSYNPGDESTGEFAEDLNWLGKVTALKDWLTHLKREIDAPDLWASLSQEQELLSLEPAEAVNTLFTAAEQVQIKKAVEEIRTYVTSTYSLAGEPLAAVNRKLDYLIDASTRLGRIDWKNIFVGALFSLALQQLSPSGPGLRELFAAAGHLFRHVLGNIISPPLIH